MVKSMRRAFTLIEMVIALAVMGLLGASLVTAATIAFRDSLHGILAGGDIAAPEAAADNVAVTRDGGRTWTLATRTLFPGAVYGLAYVPAGDGHPVVATGPSGAAWSPDEGRSWRALEGIRDYWAVGAAAPGVGWLVGTEGRILKLSF